MKTRLLIIIGIIIVAVIASGVSAYLYSEMYDCLNPPVWMKFPRQYGLGDCLRMYTDGTLPDWTQERERHAKEQALRTDIIKMYENHPEVVAFYQMYDDANVSVREELLSYFAGNGDDFRARLNLYLDTDYSLDHIEFHCYENESLRYEIAQEDIVSHLQNHHCMTFGKEK